VNFVVLVQVLFYEMFLFFTFFIFILLLRSNNKSAKVRATYTVQCIEASRIC